MPAPKRLIRSLPLPFGVLVAGLLSVAPPSRAAEQGPYPIWWSPSLELESLDKIDQRLARDIYPGEEGFRVHVGLGGKRRTVLANDCAELRALERESGGAVTSPDISLEFIFEENCLALETLKRARPADRSHVRDFALNAAALAYLPAMVTPGASCDWMCRLYVANERRIPLTEFVTGLLRATLKNDHEFEIETDLDTTRVEILARADFNFDGLEDLLVHVFSKAKEGGWGARELFVMTREAPDAVLRVMDADRYVCDPETYHVCDPRYDVPPALR